MRRFESDQKSPFGENYLKALLWITEQTTAFRTIPTLGEVLTRFPDGLTDAGRNEISKHLQSMLTNRSLQKAYNHEFIF